MTFQVRRSIFLPYTAVNFIADARKAEVPRRLFPDMQKRFARD